MTPLSALVELCRNLERSPGRLDKLRLVADFLSGLGTDEAAGAVAYLTGRSFPGSDPRALGVRGLPSAEPAATSSLTLGEVGEAFGAVAAAAGGIDAVSRAGARVADRPGPRGGREGSSPSPPRNR